MVLKKFSSVSSAIEAEEISHGTDMYFHRTRGIIEKFGDEKVTYAIFLRRPVVSAPRLALDWLAEMQAKHGYEFEVDLRYAEGRWVGAGEPLLYISGSFKDLVQLETYLLQLLGAACVAAYNAFIMCSDLPQAEFMAMDARHCAGAEMSEMMAYAAKVGSDRAKGKSGAKGFIGTSTTATAHYFGLEAGLGTMPHALVGYAGSTVAAARMYRETYEDSALTVLVDYFGQEVTDSLAVCAEFPDLAEGGSLSLRMDTVGGRYCEGLDSAGSYEVLARCAPEAIRGYRSEDELRHLIGAGVSAAAIWHLREALDGAGFAKVRIVASGGFTPEKCRVMALAGVPIDVVGTGSYLPDRWNETYATADIVRYGDKAMVKKGREFLIE